jgi:hypothetical protein
MPRLTAPLPERLVTPRVTAPLPERPAVPSPERSTVPSPWGLAGLES